MVGLQRVRPAAKGAIISALHAMNERFIVVSSDRVCDAEGVSDDVVTSR
jgi:hypothetical protein